MKTSLFQEYWSRFSTRSNRERARYFSSLSNQAQKRLIRSFFEEGWCELIVYNIVDSYLDDIKKTYNIDIIDMRIQALKGRRFLIPKDTWEKIEGLLLTYKDFYNSNILFGGITAQHWGRYQQFYLIKKHETKNSCER